MKYPFLILFCISYLLGGCGRKESSPDIQNGDLIFVSAGNSELSRAINDVTQTGEATSYTHMGIVEVNDKGIWVIHSAPEKGVSRESLDDFKKGDGETQRQLVLYRVIDTGYYPVKEAVVRANLLVGSPYNSTYIMEDTGYYCSEFIYAIFSTSDLFSLNPMTFKDPESGETLPAWKEHYAKMGIPVPEGKPGCNPNGMAANTKLRKVGVVE